MTTKKLTKLLALYLPYILLGLVATNFGEAWRLAEGKELGDRGWPLRACEAVGTAAGAAGGSEMKIITVEHEVSPEHGKCTFSGDYYGKDVCKYHALRTQTHGRKAPPEYRKPKCLLFDCWLEQPYKKCEACKKACMEAEYDNGTTAFHG